MLRVVAIETKVLEIVEAQRDRGVVNVRWRQVLAVVDDVADVVAALARVIDVRDVCSAALAPSR